MDDANGYRSLGPVETLQSLVASARFSTALSLPPPPLEAVLPGEISPCLIGSRRMFLDGREATAVNVGKQSKL
jgi:hypothetical protein